ncbi:VOC family protein [Candidatus Bathyarchaeota archaeon]|nr:VOC family protein [Candidatus Bathyarchaeota archaeon]
MKLKKIAHVAIAVRDLDKALKYFKDVFGLEPLNGKVYESKDEKLLFTFLPIGDTFLEVMAPTDPTSYLAKFIEEKGEGLHHFVIAVDNIEECVDELKSKGVKLWSVTNVGETTPLFDKVCRGTSERGKPLKFTFLDPESTLGAIIELEEEIED